MEAPRSEKMVPPMADTPSENKVFNHIPEDIHFSVLSKHRLESLYKDIKFSYILHSDFASLLKPSYLLGQLDFYVL